VTQAYYFNPKQVKRQQLVRMIAKLKDNVKGNDENNDPSNRQNFFERKRNVDRTGGRNPLQKRRSFD
jgi:hypothetical protein